MTQFESRLDRATFRRSNIFGGIDLMAARFVRHSFAPHSHDDLMIGVMHGGVKAFRHGRSRQYAGSGSLSVVNPGEMHTGERAHGEELVYAALYVPETVLAAMSPRLSGGRSAIRQAVVDDHAVWRCLALAHRLGMDGEDVVAAEQAMTRGVSLLVQRYGATRFTESDAGCPKAVNRAKAFLEARACDHISLVDASNAAGVGLHHLIKLFTQHLGLTPHAYLTQVRIARSRDLLRRGEPAAQVALDVGFADQAHFTKRFKQFTGTTPALYARSMH